METWEIAFIVGLLLVLSRVVYAELKENRPGLPKFKNPPPPPPEAFKTFKEAIKDMENPPPEKWYEGNIDVGPKPPPRKQFTSNPPKETGT